MDWRRLLLVPVVLVPLLVLFYVSFDELSKAEAARRERVNEPGVAEHMCEEYGLRITYQATTAYATSTHYHDCDPVVLYYKAKWGEIIFFDLVESEEGLLISVAFQDDQGAVRLRQWPFEVFKDVRDGKKVMVKFREGGRGVDLVPHQ